MINSNRDLLRMKILILGITGMLGHAVWFNLKESHEAFGSIRGNLKELSESCSLFNENDKNILYGIDVHNDNDLKRALDIAEPGAIVNCVGVVKQLDASKFPIPSISLNALFPHRLAKMCNERNIRMIHISTDCVFSGKRGGYVESNIPDAHDLYGRTKVLGEVTENDCLTIRTSIVGRQLSGSSGLFEWFLSQNGEVRGYRKAIFSGLTTYALSDIIRTLIEGHPTVSGLYHVSSEPISKYDLLNKLKNLLKLDTEIISDDRVVIDRSLDSTKFRELTHIYIPSWDEMLEDFAKRVADYQKWRYNI
ncbi:MAG: SDR family oxidoreductase [Thermodesulfobacteriota bacterium]|nr:SDR family oxidoreductase [Thermodesulfobacteriota bacterium]